MTHDQEVRMLELMSKYGYIIQGIQQQLLTLATTVQHLAQALKEINDRIETQFIVNNLLKPLDPNDRRG